MGPEDNTPPRIEVYYVNNAGWDKLDPETAAWVKMYMQAFMNQMDNFDFEPKLGELSVQEELEHLTQLDAQIADHTECPQALAWIEQAVQRVRDRG